MVRLVQQVPGRDHVPVPVVAGSVVVAAASDRGGPCMKLGRYLTLLFLIVLVFCTVYFWTAWIRWEAYATGSYNCPKSGCPGGVAHNYNFFSGWGSDFIPSIITVLGLAVGYWWHNQCHVSGCYWLSLPHTTAAGDKACWRHHPHKRMTHELLLHRHRTARAGAENAAAPATVVATGPAPLEVRLDGVQIPPG
ncbi:MAG TPA: hypothetical protein VGI66_17525 [Streptosporangiaceae bacterium]